MSTIQITKHFDHSVALEWQQPQDNPEMRDVDPKLVVKMEYILFITSNLSSVQTWRDSKHSLIPKVGVCLLVNPSYKLQVNPWSNFITHMFLMEDRKLSLNKRIWEIND